MNNLQRIGGISALIEAAAFAFGIIMAVTVLSPFVLGGLDSEQLVGYMAERRTALLLWNMVIYLIFGVALVPLVLALQERLKSGSAPLVRVASVFGLLWAGLVIASGMIFSVGLESVVAVSQTDPIQAASAWQAISAVQSGLGGGIELVGALWILLLSWAALRGDWLPRGLNYLGVLIGVVGAVTMVPGLGDLGAAFGLGSIVWFLWLGTFMLRAEPVRGD